MGAGGGRAAAIGHLEEGQGTGAAVGYLKGPKGRAGVCRAFKGSLGSCWGGATEELSFSFLFFTPL